MSTKKAPFQLWRWLQLIKCFQLRKKSCTCVLNKKRLCILIKTSKICHSSWKIWYFQRKRRLFAIEGISSAVIIFKAEKARFLLTLNSIIWKYCRMIKCAFLKKFIHFSSHWQKFNFSLKNEHFLKCYLRFKKALFASNLLWDVIESFWSHQICLG